MLINGVRDFMMRSKATPPVVFLRQMVVRGSPHLIELSLKQTFLSAERSQIVNSFMSKVIK